MLELSYRKINWLKFCSFKHNSITEITFINVIAYCAAQETLQYRRQYRMQHMHMMCYFLWCFTVWLSRSVGLEALSLIIPPDTHHSSQRDGLYTQSLIIPPDTHHTSRRDGLHTPSLIIPSDTHHSSLRNGLYTPSLIIPLDSHYSTILKINVFMYGYFASCERRVRSHRGATERETNVS